MPQRKDDRNPFEGVTDYFSELNRMRWTGTHGREPSHQDKERTHSDAWVPATDIYAVEDDLLIDVELAGVRPDDVDLTFAHGVLTVSGSRQADPTTPGADRFYVRERFFGEFRRAVTLPEGVEQRQISAAFADGLVQITVQWGARRSDDSRIELRDDATGPTTRSLG